MREYSNSAVLMGKEINVRACFTGSGVNVAVCGGDRPHIGAVTVISPTGEVTEQQFPTHRDGAVSSAWAAGLYSAFGGPVVVEAGIHYDNITKEGIAAVLECTDRLLARLIQSVNENN